MGTAGPLPEVKRLGPEANSTPSVPRLSMSGVIPVFPPHAFMPCTWTTLPGTNFIQSYDDSQEGNKSTDVNSILYTIYQVCISTGLELSVALTGVSLIGIENTSLEVKMAVAKSSILRPEAASYLARRTLRPGHVIPLTSLSQGVVARFPIIQGAYFYKPESYFALYGILL
jgi:hypothetical protein